MNEGIVVLSLFDGMSCAQIALERAGIKVRKYYASEIDKYVIQITQKHYPDTIQLGDINNWQEWNIDVPDLILAGSPCQGFSNAGRGLNFDDPRSKLFFVFCDILAHYYGKNPSLKYMLENVKMKKEWREVITDRMKVEPVLINSALVSAQNRERLYWANWTFPQPEDKHIYLKDIIECGVVDRDKSFCLDANYWKGTTVEQYLSKGRRQIAFTERRTDEAKRIRKEFREKFERDFCPRRAKELTPRQDGKMNCLTSTFSLKEHTLIDEKLFYRKLTPLECERLQTLKDNYTYGVSNTQRYRMIGAGWTIDVVAHMLSYMNKEQSL